MEIHISSFFWKKKSGKLGYVFFYRNKLARAMTSPFRLDTSNKFPIIMTLSL